MASKEDTALTYEIRDRSLSFGTLREEDAETGDLALVLQMGRTVFVREDYKERFEASYADAIKHYKLKLRPPEAAEKPKATTPSGTAPGAGSGPAAATGGNG